LFSASSPEGAYVFDSSGKKQLFLEEYMFVEIYGDILIAKDKLYFEHYLVDGKDAIPSAGCLTWNDEAQILISSAYEACACYTKGGEKLPLPIMKNIEVISPERFIYCQWGSYLYGICASDGTIIAPADYLSLFQCIDTNFCIFIKSEAGKQTQGVIDVASGRILLEGYDSIWYEGGGLFGVISGKTSGLVDTNGGWLWRSDESTTELADLIQL
jgi:hypothetical protein